MFMYAVINMHCTLFVTVMRVSYIHPVFIGNIVV